MRRYPEDNVYPSQSLDRFAKVTSGTCKRCGWCKKDECTNDEADQRDLFPAANQLCCGWRKQP